MTLVSYEYDVAFGEGTAAQPGMVMLRIAQGGKIMAEIHMPPEEFAQLAHSIENVQRGIESRT